MKSYKDLEVYQNAMSIAITIYKKTMLLPKPDIFETGSQIRRSSQSIKDNIVEGYGRRKYKADFIKFLTYAMASLLEATSQSDFLHEIHPNTGWDEVSEKLTKLGSQLHNFISFVKKSWKV